MVAVAVAVAARRRHLQQPRQLRVAERRVRRAAAVAGEGGDDAAEREQRHVRRLRLVGGDAHGARLLDALRAGEVDDVQLRPPRPLRRLEQQLRHLARRGVGDGDGLLALHEEREDGVRAARAPVHLGGADGAVGVGERDELQRLLERRHRVAHEPVDHHRTPRVGAVLAQPERAAAADVEQVLELLLVELHAREPDREAAVGGGGEDAAQRARQHALVVRAVGVHADGVRLARARLPVREHGAVRPAGDRRVDDRRQRVERVRLRGVRPEHVAERPKFAAALELDRPADARHREAHPGQRRRPVLRDRAAHARVDVDFFLLLVGEPLPLLRHYLGAVGVLHSVSAAVRSLRNSPPPRWPFSSGALQSAPLSKAYAPPQHHGTND